MKCQGKDIRYLQNQIQKPSTKIIYMRELNLHAVLGVVFFFVCHYIHCYFFD